MPEGSNEKTIPVRVAVRIRPLQPKEKCEGCQECMNIVPGEPQVVIGEQKAFTYDYVFGTNSQQVELYSKAVSPLLEGFFGGYNATVLAYGQTGSGKTFSMGTNLTITSAEDERERGVIPRVITDIFKCMEDRREKTEFLVRASFLEIHNEEIQDLLSPSANTSDDRLVVREDSDGGIKIAGLQELTVTSVQEMFNLLQQGSASRVTASTAMNRHSSRSHAIFTITMEQKDKSEMQGGTKKAKFHLVDLAGSERAKKTLAQGERFKEGVNINKGLLCLGNVISALSDENRKSGAHVPYRDSKLTRLLQDSLGGNSNTVMIACVSPADNSFDETLNTLRYADRARQIKNKPIVNRDPAAAELAKLRQQVQMLQIQLLQGQTINGSLAGDVTQVNSEELIERVKQLEVENETLSSELHSSVEQNAHLYEKVLLVEISRDKMLQKYGELKLQLGDTLSAKDNPEIEANETNAGLALDLQKKLHEFEESMNVSAQLNQVEGVEDASDKEPLSDVARDSVDTPDSPSPAESSFATQHALRQAELARQLKDLTKKLTAKEELASTMAQNDARIAAVRKQYEDTVRELEGEIVKLENEKVEIHSRLTEAKSTMGSEMGAKAKARIKELERKIQELKKKQVENQRLLSEKQQRDRTITKLNSDIQSIKSARVKLMRHMKEEAEKFRTMKAEKEKEILQLKQQGRKRQFEYKKLETIHSKQQAVLKRKTEEVAAAQKRLKEALQRQKEANDKRSNQQHLQSKQMESLGPRMRSWVSHEVEVLVSVGQARQTLHEMIEDRKVLSHELAELKSRLQEMEGQPPAKKRAPGRAASDDVSQKIKALDTELKFRSDQISELQRKIMGAEQGEKSKYRWNSIHTMAEAKAGLQALLEMTVSAKLSELTLNKHKEKTESSYQELKSNMESLLDDKEKKIAQLKEDEERTITNLQKQHEEKVSMLLQQLPQNDSNNESLQHHAQDLTLQLEEARNVNDSLRNENSELKQQLSKLMAVFDRDTPTPTLEGEESENVAPAKHKVVVKLGMRSPAVRSPIFPSLTESRTTSKKAKPSGRFVYIDDEDEDWESDVQDDSITKDPDWRKTPARLQKRRSQEKNDEAVQGCLCKGKCKTSACSCRKNDSSCCENCQCRPTKCSNREASSTSSSLSATEDPPTERKVLVELNQPTKSENKPFSIDAISEGQNPTGKPRVQHVFNKPRNAANPSGHKENAYKRIKKVHSSSSASSDEDTTRTKQDKRIGVLTAGLKRHHTPKSQRIQPHTPDSKKKMVKRLGWKAHEGSLPKMGMSSKAGKRKLLRPSSSSTLLGSIGTGDQ